MGVLLTGRNDILLPIINNRSSKFLHDLNFNLPSSERRLEIKDKMIKKYIKKLALTSTDTTLSPTLKFLTSDPSPMTSPATSDAVPKKSFVSKNK